MDKYVLVLVALRLCTAQQNTCPSAIESRIHDMFGLSNEHANVQQGVWHRLPCLSYRQSDEVLLGVIWYRGSNIDDPGKERLISHTENIDLPDSDRYALSSGFSLVIKGVMESDEGRYLCQIVPRDTSSRVGEINIQVIVDSFPASASDASSSASFQRGRRQTLPCQCAPQTTDAPISVVYWSMGEGVTTDTEIIGARFSDGTVLQIQHGADYSIGSDISLTVNSLKNAPDSARFWCHAYMPDGMQSDCYTDVRISAVEQLTHRALKASDTTFYLQNEARQTLPCTTWTSGNRTCEIQWFKVDATGQYKMILNYNLSTGVIDTDTTYNLASDFDLLIEQVGDDHAGNFACDLGPGTTRGVITVFVIGAQFPLDGGTATAGNPKIVASDRNFTLTCPALSGIATGAQAIVIWSFGEPIAEVTSVIGTFNLSDGSKTFAMGDSGCFGISSEGSLIMNNCSQEGDGRYWCHVFPYGDVLIRSYVDVIIETEGPRHTTVPVDLQHTTAAKDLQPEMLAAISVPILVVLLMMFAVIVRWRWKRGSKLQNDPERVQYRPVPSEPVQEFDLSAFLDKIKTFVKQTTSQVPITPWITDDDVCYAPMNDVYIPPELFVNVCIEDGTVRYKLDSESGIFNDGILELANKHVLIQGRTGSGKTIFLHKLANDWSIGLPGALFGGQKLVFVLPVDTLITAENLGKAVVQHMLPADTSILAKDINDYCSHHTSEVAILIDGCNDRHETERVVEIIKGQGLNGCQMIITMTTGNPQMTEKRCMRHVTITGFTPDSACKYINKVLNVSLDRDHIKQLPKSTGRSQVTGTDNTCNTFDTACEHAHEMTDEQKEVIRSNLCEYLNEDILQPYIACLPVNLAAFCQLSIWTKGDVFQKPRRTMYELIFQLVKCLFERRQEVGATDKATYQSELCELGGLLPKTQLEVLVDLGRVALPQIYECNESQKTLSKVDFRSCEAKHTVLNMGAEIGILCSGKDVNREQVTDITKDSSELIHSTFGDRKVRFTLELLQEYCAGTYMAYCAENSSDWITTIHTSTIESSVVKIANVFAFAIACKYGSVAYSKLVNHLVSNVIRARVRIQTKELKDVLRLQTLVERILLLNFEGRYKGSINQKIGSLFDGGKVQLNGISRHSVRLLSYLLKYPREENNSLNVKSVELFRISQYDWGELQEYIAYFHPGLHMGVTSVTAPTAGMKQPASALANTESASEVRQSKNVNLEPVDSHLEIEPSGIEEKQKSQCINTEPDSEKVPEGTVSSDVGLPKIQTEQSDIDLVNPMQSLDRQELPESESASEMKHVENHEKGSTDSPTMMEESGIKNIQNPENQNSQSKDIKTESFDVIGGEYETATLKQLRERIESSDNMPVFPPDQSDISVLHTVQSLGLQELLESQSGECHSSRAARELAQCLPGLKKLESLVLVGTILSSKDMCDFAKHLNELSNLKKIDLRLNKQFDDSAFAAITNSLHACEKLTDLRLSLYRVTEAGFDHVRNEMEKNDGKSWGNLKTLYLLHSSKVETFVSFLANSLKCFNGVKKLHISAIRPGNEITLNLLDKFHENMCNPKIMPSLKELLIDNMETLKAKFASWKLPKKGDSKSSKTKVDRAEKADPSTGYSTDTTPQDHIPLTQLQTDKKELDSNQLTSMANVLQNMQPGIQEPPM